MEAVASSSRVQASDLNGPVDTSLPPVDYAREDRRERRASPSYDASAAAARQQSNGNGNGNGNANWRRHTPERALGHHDEGSHRRQYDSRGPPPQRNQYGGNRGGGNADFFASRQAERDASNLSIWPPSPKTPRNEDSEDERDRHKRKKDKKHKSHKSSHRHKKKRYSSETESDSDDDDDDERRHKSKKHRSSKHRHRSDDDELNSSEYERERSKRKKEKEKKRSSHKHRDHSRSRSRSRTVERIHNDQEDEWAEKGSKAERGVPGTSLVASTAGADKSGLTSSKGKGKESGAAATDSDSDDEVGPKPLPEASDKSNTRDYGGALLRGEGEAMAAYVADGQRIPRRGEIGLESEQITKYEEVGYVMSGSRHRRMNAVRMRKENQVITAEEKRQLLKTQKEEQDKKETMVVSSFKELLEQRLQGEKRKQRDNY